MRGGRWMAFLRFVFFLAFFFFAAAALVLMGETAASSEEDTARGNLKSSLQGDGCARAQGPRRAGAEAAEEEGERQQQRRRRRSTMGLGSHPPRCATRCGVCTPCRPVHVAVPPAATAEYYPEAWWCDCRGRLFSP